MPATSRAQQQLMAIAEHHPEQVRKRNRGVLKMTKGQLHDFAATKGLQQGGKVGKTVASPDPASDTAYYPLQESHNSYAERQDRLGTPESQRYRDANDKRDRPGSVPEPDQPGGWFSRPKRSYSGGGSVCGPDHPYSMGYRRVK